MLIIVKTVKEEVYEVESSSIINGAAEIKDLRPKYRKSWQTIRSK